MRIGLVGAGRIGAFRASTLRGLPGVDSLVVTDADLALAREVAGRLGVEAAGSVAELLGAGIDGLVIAATEFGPDGYLPREPGQRSRLLAGVVAALEAADYGGWYVLEQDVILDGPPQDEGPARGVRESLYYLRGLLGGPR
jgi:predicted alpha-1,6-mannanase (GH76 family)